MGFLTNLLPGVRDLRTPLVTGYAWLLALWLWSTIVHDMGGARDKTATIFGPLTSYYGHAVTVAALTVVAFLVGSLITLDAGRLGTSPFERFLFAAYNPIAARHPYIDRGRPKFHPQRERYARERIAYQVRGRYRLRVPDIHRVLAFLLNDPSAELELRTELVKPRERWEKRVSADVKDKTEAARATLFSLDAPSLSIRLHIQNAELWNQYDRLVAEAELRFSVALPVFVGGLALAIRIGGAVIWLALVPAALAISVYLAGSIRARMANGVLIQCLMTDVVSDPRVDAHRGVVRNGGETGTSGDGAVPLPHPRADSSVTD